MRLFRWIIIFSALAAAILLSLYSCTGEDPENPTEESRRETENTSELFNTAEKEKRKLVCKNITEKEFNDSLKNPRIYTVSESVTAGVIPHHAVAATLISGFFKAAAESGSGGGYDSVIIVAPNHRGDIAEVVLSFCDWETGSGETVYCDADITTSLYEKKTDNYFIAEDDGRVEEDHSASILIPYVNHYFPEAKVAAFLVSRTMTLENVLNFAETLSKIIKESGKKVLLVCSADFSHYLPPALAAENDEITKQAIQNRNYKKIHNFTNEYLDSPASLITFLVYLSETEQSQRFLDNTDASEFISGVIFETTTYFVIAASAPE